MNEQQKIKQARVLTEGSGWDCYLFARDIMGLQARLFALGCGDGGSLFGQHIEGADIPALQARVLAVGDGDDCYWFARDIEGADIDALQARIKELKEV